MEKDPKEKTKDNLAESLEKQETHLNNVIFHIEQVHKAGKILASRIIALGGQENIDFARDLLANCFVHDASKLKDAEFKYLVKDGTSLEIAKEYHHSCNPHHVEYWGDIETMPSVYLAELVCDAWARSSELGTDLRQWMDNKLLKELKVPKTGKVYKKVKYYLDLILESPF